MQMISCYILPGLCYRCIWIGGWYMGGAKRDDGGRPTALHFLHCTAARWQGHQHAAMAARRLARTTTSTASTATWLAPARRRPYAERSYIPAAQQRGTSTTTAAALQKRQRDERSVSASTRSSKVSPAMAGTANMATAAAARQPGRPGDSFLYFLIGQGLGDALEVNRAAHDEHAVLK